MGRLSRDKVLDMIRTTVREQEPDAILNRGNSSSALLLIDLCRVGMIQGYVAPITFANIAYILRKKSREEIHSTLNRISMHLNILSMDGIQLKNAIEYGPVDDFEDMMQYQCAKAGDCNTIITNNGKDYKPFSRIPIMNADEFLSQMLNSASE